MQFSKICPFSVKPRDSNPNQPFLHLEYEQKIIYSINELASKLLCSITMNVKTDTALKWLHQQKCNKIRHKVQKNRTNSYKKRCYNKHHKLQ